MIFTGDHREIAQSALDHGALKCFEYERRTMPAQILGLGNAGAVGKFVRVNQALCLETGSENMELRRGTITGWLADQGVDLAIGDCPDPGGNALEILEEIRAGRFDLHSPESKGAFFFPHAITIPDILHIMFNALQESLESSDAWPPFEAVFRTVVTTIGDKMVRDRVCGVGLPNADRADRRLIHNFKHYRFDWRWEVLEVLSVQVAQRWPILESADMDAVSKDGDLAAEGLKILRRCLENNPNDIEGVELMTNACAVVSQAVGENARWVRGCECHKDLFASTRFPEARVQLMLEMDPSCRGTCVWMGRRLVHMAHDGCARMCRRVEEATSDRYEELLRRSRPELSTKILVFERHVKSRWVCTITDKSA